MSLIDALSTEQEVHISPLNVNLAGSSQQVKNGDGMILDKRDATRFLETSKTILSAVCGTTPSTMKKLRRMPGKLLRIRGKYTFHLITILTSSAVRAPLPWNCYSS